MKRFSLNYWQGAIKNNDIQNMIKRNTLGQILIMILDIWVLYSLMFQAMFNNLLIIYQGLPCFFFSKLPNTYKRMCMFDRKHKKNLGK